MKKVFLSLATIAFVAAGSLTVTSCGSDDSTTNPVEAGIKMTLTTDPNEIYAGEAFELSITEADGTPITGAILIANGEATEIESDEGVFSLQAPEGEWEFSASYEGKESNVVAVTVKPSRAVSEGEGVITYNGGTMDIESAYVVFRGLYYRSQTDQTVVAIWQIEGVSGNTAALVQFETPTTPIGGNQYNYEMPGATNTTGRLARVYVGDAVDGDTTENVKVNFGATYADNFFTGTYSATSADIKSQPFALEFTGKTPRVNNTGKAAKGGAITFENAVQIKTLKATNLRAFEAGM